MFNQMAIPRQYNRYEFICDSKSDIVDLPSQTNTVEGYHTPAPGSVAFVVDDTLCYVYGNDGEWHEI